MCSYTFCVDCCQATQEVSAQQFSGLTLLPKLPTPDLSGSFGFPWPNSAGTAQAESPPTKNLN